jgi:hypothetical protein
MLLWHNGGAYVPEKPLLHLKWVLETDRSALQIPIKTHNEQCKVSRKCCCLLLSPSLKNPCYSCMPTPSPWNKVSIEMRSYGLKLILCFRLLADWKWRWLFLCASSICFIVTMFSHTVLFTVEICWIRHWWVFKNHTKPMSSVWHFAISKDGPHSIASWPPSHWRNGVHQQLPCR